MRHKVSGRKFDRAGDERKALLRGLVADLMRHERMKTTEAKAKEVRPIAEKMITLGKDGTVHARRQALAYINDKDVVKKLFDDIAPRFAERPGGYTRILRTGYRRGDSAETAQIELIGSEYDPNAATEAEGEKPKARKKGVGGRLRAAAERLRGKAKADGEEGEAAEGAPKKKPKPERTYGKGGKADTRGKGAKTSTPRKAGGS